MQAGPGSLARAQPRYPAGGVGRPGHILTITDDGHPVPNLPGRAPLILRADLPTPDAVILASQDRVLVVADRRVGAGSLAAITAAAQVFALNMT